uniref:UBA domain-containing protein n=1 Tax=Glossina pallidipes TaxID=7398 RepID=A0A1A9ZNF3_GLOPL
MSKIDDITMRVRARLHELCIKLWLPPYYEGTIGADEFEIENLADQFSGILGIPKSDCTLALIELQENAIRKSKARAEFATTGVATFNVRRVNNRRGTESIVEVKCPLTSLGGVLQKNIAKILDIDEPDRIKCISAGKILDPCQSLTDQGIKNNQQLMLIISEASKKEQMQGFVVHDRIQKIKQDVETIVDSNSHLFELEDQDSNAVLLPPAENRAILIAMGICERARVAIKRERYDEALILLLEADKKFIICNSKFLECVDNYALLNLDIVWCYLCLQNVTQLPDAQRRLEICEKNFRRTYGENLQRLVYHKGETFCEQALIMRLHLLQGAVLFHQNKRSEAYEKFLIAENELRALKVNENSMEALVEMGYEPYEARLGLRACGGDIEQAITYIHAQNQKLNETRSGSLKKRRLNQDLSLGNQNKNWVSPSSVCTLIEMGYPSNLVEQALLDSKNDLNIALDLLQNYTDELRRKLSSDYTVDARIMQQLLQLGFEESHVRIALQMSPNNLENAIDILIKYHTDCEDLSSFVKRMTAIANEENIPSTSNGLTSLAEKIAKKATKEIESLNAFVRFKEELSDNELDYLDLSLAQEEQILEQYKLLIKIYAQLLLYCNSCSYEQEEKGEKVI